MRYAVAFGEVDPWALTDDVLLPLEVVDSLGGGTRGAEGSALTVHGAEVSSVRRVGGLLEIRVFNPEANPTLVDFGPGHEGFEVDLAGRVLGRVTGPFELRPFGIVTFRMPG
jgi:hypothetical protein